MSTYDFTTDQARAFIDAWLADEASAAVLDSSYAEGAVGVVQELLSQAVNLQANLKAKAEVTDEILTETYGGDPLKNSASFELAQTAVRYRAKAAAIQGVVDDYERILGELTTASTGAPPAPTPT